MDKNDPEALTRLAICLETSMIQYEFRILRSGRKPSLVIEAFHPTDDVAIHTLSKLADDHAVEVWREKRCIYRAPAKVIDGHVNAT